MEEIGSEITLKIFEGLTLYPRFLRLPGMEREDVLEEGGNEGRPKNFFETVVSRFVLPSYFCFTMSYMGYIKHQLFFNTEEATSKDLIPVQQQAVINIFRVASGLLYEVSHCLWSRLGTAADVFNSDLSVS